MKNRIKNVEDKRGSNIQSHKARSLSTDHLYPAFSLTYLDREYCITKCEDSEQLALIDKIYRLSQLSWTQIKQTGRQKLGCEPIDQTVIERPIPLHLTPDVTILAFRFNGDKARMIGYREGNIFHIIWLDPKLKLYHH